MFYAKYDLLFQKGIIFLLFQTINIQRKKRKKGEITMRTKTFVRILAALFIICIAGFGIYRNISKTYPNAFSGRVIMVSAQIDQNWR